MFSMAKIWAAVVAAFGFVLILLKLEKSKNEKLEDKNQALEVEAKIDDSMDKATETAKQNEVKRNEDRKNNSDSDPFTGI